MKKVIGSLIISAMFFIFFQTVTAYAKENRMWLHFIDVGQGDSILIQTPNHKNILIDAGPKRTEDKVTAYLKRQHVEQLDALIVTHPHHDHIGGVPRILQNIKVKAFYMPHLSKKTAAFTQMMKALKQKNVMIFYANAGNKIDVEKNIWIDIIGPLSAKYHTVNDYSYVLRVVHGANRFLLMGDSGERSETELLKKHVDVEANVIKIAHHGANTGTTLPFLEKVDPEAAIITTGRRNQHNYPSDAVISRLVYLKIPTYRTDRMGTIIVESDGETIHFTSEGTGKEKRSAPYFKPFLSAGFGAGK